MRRFACLALIALASGACGGGDDPSRDDGDWSLAEPAEVGLDEAALERGDRRIARTYPAVRSVLVARRGRLVFERYYHGANEMQAFEVHSVAKSVVSALVGVTLANGDLPGLDTRFIDVFPEYLEQGSDPRIRRITIRDLLTMRAGYSAERIRSSSNWMRTLVNRPVVSDPGTRFRYDSGSSHLLSGLLTEVTGKKASALARQLLFGPLGIRDGWRWPDDGRGVTLGGGGLAMRARDLLKLGQLYLQEGRWNEEQVVPSSWVRESTRKHANVGSRRQGYGYQWWVSEEPSARAYLALGYGGQAIAVFPTLDLVAVVTAAPSTDTDVRAILHGLIVPAVASR